MLATRSEQLKEEALAGYVEATADLHRAITFLWQGVKDKLSERDASVPLAQTSDFSRDRASSSTAIVAADVTDDGDNTSEESILRIIQNLMGDEEVLDIPMHLDDLPFESGTMALIADVRRVHASTSLLKARNVVRAAKPRSGTSDLSAISSSELCGGTR